MKHGDSVKTIFWGILLILGACWFWHHLCGNPFAELALIRHGRVTSGFIVDAWEVVTEGDTGQTIWSHGATYTYTLPDGRTFTQRTRDASGRLRDEFQNLQQPRAIKVEYLPDNPSISRIKREGNDSLGEWLWRKVGLGGLLLAALLSPGVVLIRSGIHSCRKKHGEN